MLLGWSEAVSNLQSSSRCWKRCCLIIKVVSFSVQYGIEQHNQYVTKVPSLPGKLCVLVRKCLAISCIPNRFLDSVKWGCRWFQIQASTTPGINTAEISAFATRCVQFHGIKTSVRAVWIHSHSLQFGSFAADLIPSLTLDSNMREPLGFTISDDFTRDIFVIFTCKYGRKYDRSWAPR